MSIQLIEVPVDGAQKRGLKHGLGIFSSPDDGRSGS
jgi:hypothetical protein